MRAAKRCGSVEKSPHDVLFDCFRLGGAERVDVRPSGNAPSPPPLPVHSPLGVILGPEKLIRTHAAVTECREGLAVIEMAAIAVGRTSLIGLRPDDHVGAQANSIVKRDALSVRCRVVPDGLAAVSA